jgi:hypothetical protein
MSRNGARPFPSDRHLGHTPHKPENPKVGKITEQSDISGLVNIEYVLLVLIYPA